MGSIAVLHVCTLASSMGLHSGASFSHCTGTLTYNGICEPPKFPPRQPYSRDVPHPPYLDNPPSVINVTIGRQLLAIDSFLVESSNATQTFHSSTYHPESPVVVPDKPWEGTFAMPFSGGAWWDDDRQSIALWYRYGTHCFSGQIS